MHACTIISFAALGTGLIASIVVLFSLPFIPDASVFIASIDFVFTGISPQNSTLSGNGTLDIPTLAFHNLTSLRMGNWAVCLFDNQTFSSAEQQGVLCTHASVGYTVTLTDENNDTFTLVPALWTVPLAIHIVAFLFYLVAMFPKINLIWTFIAIGFNASAVAYDYLFFTLVRNSLVEKEGVSVAVGPSAASGIISVAFLCLGIFARTAA